MKNNLFRRMIHQKDHSKITSGDIRSRFFCLLLLLLATIPAFGSILQDTKISIQQKDVSLNQVFREIESKTGYSFLIRNNDVNINDKVSIDAKDKNIEEILSILFAGKNIKYEVTGKQISVYKPAVVKSGETRKITGIVKDELGEPMIGVSVSISGTTIGVISDIDGKFTLNIPVGNQKLEASYLGYEKQVIQTADRSEVTILMKENAAILEEIVVIGYGTARKKDLTGSVTQIRPDNIAVENPKTVQDILRGTPGLNVGYSATAKGGGDMEVRGQRSVYDKGGHNNPLLILDGMPFYGELSEINPDDIAQIDLLKDASAASVYGAKAANGVIIITTKKGKQGKPVINISTSVGMTQVADYRKRFTPEAYLQHREEWLTKNSYGVNPTTGAYEAYQTGVYATQPGYFMSPDQLMSNVSIDAWRAYTKNEVGESDQSIWAKRLGFKGNALQNLLEGKTIDWADKTYRTGFNQDYNASISGAGEKVNYYLSMGYLKNQGAEISDEYGAIRANMKVEAKVTDWFELGANVNFQDRSDLNNKDEDNINLDYDYLMRNSPYADYADAQGNPIQYPLSGDFSQRGYNYDFQKQYLELEKGYTVFNTILNAKIKLPFNITYSFNASPRFQFYYDRYFMSAELPGSDPKSRGANREQTKRFDWSLNNTINWDYTFQKKHHTVLTLVQEAEELRSWKDRIEARNILPSDALGFHNTKNGSKDNSTYSSTDTHQTADALLARLFYSYDNRYMLTTSVRRDGYSAFGSSNPYATFPSVALGWSFTNEEFFKWSNIMSHGKLRVSYGENGNRSLEDPYVALSNLSEGGGKMQGYINKSGQLDLIRYLYADRMANPNLQWEKTSSWNFGLDFGFIKDRISGSIEYYNMSTHDMIMNQRLPEFTGFPYITTNLGQVDNRGVEISLSTLNIDNENFKWTSTLGVSYNKNEIKHLYYDYENVLDAQGNVMGTKEMDDVTNKWFIGHPISAIWDYRVTGIWQKDEVAEANKYGQKPGDPKVANNYTADDKVNADGSITPVYNDKDKEFLGQTAPPVNWSFRNEFIFWKDFSVSFNIYSYMGHKRLSGNYLNFDDDGGRMTYALANVYAKEYWTVDNPTNEYGRIEAKGPFGINAQKVYNSSFIRLENISVGYTLPKNVTSRWNIERVKLYATVRNAATWSKDWEYGDPEGDSGRGGLSTRLYTFGLNLTF